MEAKLFFIESINKDKKYVWIGECWINTPMRSEILCLEFGSIKVRPYICSVLGISKILLDNASNFSILLNTKILHNRTSRTRNRKRWLKNSGFFICMCIFLSFYILFYLIFYQWSRVFSFLWILNNVNHCSSTKNISLSRVNGFKLI